MTAKCETPSVILRRGQKWLTNSPIRLTQWQCCPNTSQFEVHCKFQQECRWCGRMQVKIQNDGKVWDNGGNFTRQAKVIDKLTDSTDSMATLSQYSSIGSTLQVSATTRVIPLNASKNSKWPQNVTQILAWAKLVDKLTYSIDPMATLSQY